MRRSLTFALTLLGLFDSLYLLWVYASPSHAMVCLGSGCDEIRASRFAQIAGVPTPLFGVAMYGVLALLVFVEPLFSRAGWLRRFTTAIAGAGVVVSAALTVIEAFVIHAWCAWCVVQAIAVTLIFILSLTLLRARFDDRSQARAAFLRHALVLVLAIAVGTRAFTWLQNHAEAPVHAAEPSSAEIAERLVRPDSHLTGNAHAAVTLVEFGDLQCPSCAAAEPEMRELRKRYGDRVRFVFRQFPLEKVHQYAMNAAEASECAAQQGRFWEALDRFYAANGDLKDESLERYAGELGLDVTKFKSCLSGGATRAIIQRDSEDGRALGVRGTPTYFLGRQRIVGAPETAKFQQLLNQELAAASASAPAPTAAESAAPQRERKATKEAAETSTSATGAGFSSGSGGFLSIQGNSTDCSEDALKEPEPAMIHTAEAEKLFHEGAAFVDVRAADDFRKSHIQGAANLPLLEAQRRATELPRDKTIVLYEGGSGGNADVCAASRAVGRVLLGHAFKNVVVYQDGLAGWQKQALPTAR
ncbi:MAG: thioredoxin domain-containing protein [Acidobacteriia bacterium]|nr:thioredoxin domain-containing protein [Terriglobia bacterium]